MRRVRLTEGQLHNVIRESVGIILNEISKDKKMMSMKKAWDLGRYDQAAEFAESLKDDLYPYEYNDHYDPEGFFGYDLKNNNGLTLFDRRSYNGLVNQHEDIPDAPRDYYRSSDKNGYGKFPTRAKYHEFNQDRYADPRYIKAKTELDRLNGLKYK